MSDVCDRWDTAGDSAIWQYHLCEERFKDWFTSFFNLQEKHWDEGWGWRRCDPSWAFTKMYNAAWLMTHGIRQPLQSIWGIENISSLTDSQDRPLWPVNSSILSSPHVIFKENKLHVFAGENQRDNNPLTRVLHFYQENFLPSRWNFELVDSLESANRTMIAEKMTVINDSTETIHVFGLDHRGHLTEYYQRPPRWRRDDIMNNQSIRNQGFEFGTQREDSIIAIESPFSTPTQSNLQNFLHVLGPNSRRKLVHFFKLVNDQSNDAWKAEIIPGPSGYAERSLGLGRIDHAMTNPQDQGMYVIGHHHVSGLNYNVLIFYWWNQYDGWQNSVFTSAGPHPTDQERTQPSFSSHTLPAAVISQNGGVFVFHVGRTVKHQYSGPLIRLVKSPGHGWNIGNVSDMAGVGPEFHIKNLGRNAAATDDHGNIVVFGTNSQGELIVYAAYNRLVVENVSSKANANEKQRIVGNPFVLYGVNKFHIYGKNKLGEIIHYQWNIDGPSTVEMISIFPNSLIQEDPVSIHTNTGAGFRQHVFGVTKIDHRFPHTELSPFFLNLIHIGTFLPPAHPWHVSDDYARWAAGSLGHRDHDFRYEPEDRWFDDGEVIAAKAIYGPFTHDRIEMFCASFARTRGPELRAATMLHESTHHIFHDEHSGDDKDDWYYHTLGEIQPGLLNPDSSSHQHSAYQIEIEFLADLAEFPTDTVTVGIASDAREQAQLLLNNNIRNAVGWVVGEPRPL